MFRTSWSAPWPALARSGPASRVPLVVAFLFVLPGVRAVDAQPSVTLSGGGAAYDLSGTGRSGIVALRGDVSLSGAFRAQAGSAYFWYESQSGRAVRMLLPEVGFEAALPRVPAYVGAGLGHSLLLGDGWPEAFVLYGAVGADLGVGTGWAVRPEVRLHNVDPWAGTVGEFAVGLRRTFGDR